MLLFFVIIYLLFTIAIGFFASRYVKSSSDFMQAGRNLPPFINAAALFALWFGSETVFGASSRIVQDGFIGVVEDPFGGVLCLVLFGLFFVKKLYRLNLLTIGDLFRKKYGERVEIVSGVFMLITFFGYIAAQLVALSIILQAVTGIEPLYGLIICSVIVTLYTYVGGMWAVSITDFIQSIFIVAGMIILAVFLVSEAGGIEEAYTKTDPATFTFLPERDPVDITNWFAAWLTLGLGSLASQDIFQRVNSAKSERAAVSSTFIGAFLYLVFAMLPLLIALVAKILHPEINWADENLDTQSVLPDIVLNHTPMFVQVLFFGSLLSAVLSTCSGAILAPASILSENLIKPLSKKTYSDKQFLWIVRLSVILISTIATIMASMQSDIYELVAESSVLGIVSLLVPMVWALYSKKASATGAMFSMILGMASWIIMEKFMEIPVNAFIPALGISILSMIAGNFYERIVRTSP